MRKDDPGNRDLLTKIQSSPHHPFIGNSKYTLCSKMYRINPDIISALGEHQHDRYKEELLYRMCNDQGIWYGQTVLTTLANVMNVTHGSKDYLLLVYALRNGGIKIAMARSSRAKNERETRPHPRVFVNMPCQKPSGAEGVAHFTVSVDATQLLCWLNDSKWSKVIDEFKKVLHTDDDMYWGSDKDIENHKMHEEVGHGIDGWKWILA